MSTPHTPLAPTAVARRTGTRGRPRAWRNGADPVHRGETPCRRSKHTCWHWNPQDRYLRFGYSASDEHICKYVAQLNFERDELFGIFNRKLELIAMAHLAFSVDPSFKSCAEFGVSVAKGARARGYGSQLFNRAVMHARNEGVNQLFIHALSENTAMLKIARKAGARIERDGSESEAHLVLPPANFDSRMIELFNEQIAITDYHLKARARRFWRFLSLLQGARGAEMQTETLSE